MLEGELIQNQDKKFHCDIIKCRVESDLFSSIDNNIIDIPIANGYGNYQINPSKFRKLSNNDQIIMRYLNYENGSINNVAGICNKEKNVFGFMPHRTYVKK